VFPLEELPELNTSIPLVPASPEFMLLIVIMPLVVSVPSPLAIRTAPPVFTELRPANPCNEPPTPLVPLPTVSNIIPDRPSVAAPVPILRPPLLPLLLLPELNISMPLVPSSPAFIERMVIIPLLVAVPSPLPIPTAPPVFTVLRPANIWSEPPTLLVPLPTVNNIIPERPDVAAPVPTITAPVLPLLVLPELKTNIPLVPMSPAFMVLIVIMPLLVAVPSPLDKLKVPPVFTVLRPE
jgi:hypothetical protein